MCDKSPRIFPNTRAILFDLDGTLVDSVPDLTLAVNTALAKSGRAPYTDETIHAWVGNGPELLVLRALSNDLDVDPNLDKSLIESTLETFNASYEQNICVKTLLYPGVKDTLTQLKSHFSLGIVTNKSERFVQPVLDGLGVGNLFDLIIGGDTLPTKKPDPGPLQYAAKHFGISVDECVMVGDSKNDIIAAKAANMASVGVSYGYNYGEDIGIYKPEHVADTFSELLPLFIDA